LASVTSPRPKPSSLNSAGCTTQPSPWSSRTTTIAQMGSPGSKPWARTSQISRWRLTSTSSIAIHCPKPWLTTPSTRTPARRGSRLRTLLCTLLRTLMRTSLSTTRRLRHIPHTRQLNWQQQSRSRGGSGCGLSLASSLLPSSSSPLFWGASWGAGRRTRPETRQQHRREEARGRRREEAREEARGRRRAQGTQTRALRAAAQLATTLPRRNSPLSGRARA
jgi:hypothetical protein